MWRQSSAGTGCVYTRTKCVNLRAVGLQQLYSRPLNHAADVTVCSAVGPLLARVARAVQRADSG